ncbi:MAG: hypothetical protein WBO73_11335, partial [Gammaproteobacteria bacterium]
AWGDEHFSHVEAVNTVTEDCAEDLIAITQEISGRSVPRKSLNHLLSRPLGSRMFGHVEVHKSRRSCLSTRKTYKIWNVAVGTVKKSIDTKSLT